MRRHFFLSCLLIACATQLCASAGDSTARRRSFIKVLPVPTFGFAPETRAYIGAVALFTFRAEPPLRPSNGKAEVSFTQNKQLIFDTGLNLWLHRNTLFIQSVAGLRKFPEFFWGIGAHTTEEGKERYDCFRFDADVSAAFRLAKSKWLAGPALSYHLMWKVKPDSAGLLASGLITGSRGGVSSGAGIALRRDTRANMLHPEAGEGLLSVQVLRFSRTLGGDFSFNRIEADFRRYFRAVRNDVFAVQAYGMFHTGNPPFRMVSLMGGDVHARGYYQGRYRDRQYMFVQGEYRMQVLPRWGVVGFAGFGDVSHVLAGWSDGPLKYSVGGGIRFLVDKKEKVNMRLDFAAGRGTTGFYIAFGEAF